MPGGARQEPGARGCRVRAMSLRRKVVGKVLSTRPLPQVRVLRTYRVSPLRTPGLYLRYALCDRELTNFTYDIDNLDELATFVATALGRPTSEIETYLLEVADDNRFLADLSDRLKQRRDRNPRPLFGRRLGWYALVRATKPRLVVETGTADGLGTALLARAVQRNEADGWPGRVLSFDVDPTAGWLLSDELRGVAHVVTGDAGVCIKHELRDQEVGVFIHDSLHTYEHELLEFKIALNHAAETLFLISDNAHSTTALMDTAAAVGGAYGFFREHPAGHFYPGAGIGLAIVRRPAVDRVG